jgi:toxin ParE1/3/4
MADTVGLDWSQEALADLDRFATFLHAEHPDLAQLVARELIARTEMLQRHPTLGRRLLPGTPYREIVLRVLGATYALQYRYDGRAVLMLRVFHGREAR